ncbi:transcription termination factor MTERF8, chloroplastic [Coffea eugenioides]|uniref:Transcription termination factor MTERF8, chloroplastic-like n=1 Tax=Coffea arabica TaxID=13443 RepID=A0A6P6W3L5_COFAR|nr:transcription termination factor MTERF8, chloroplastic-like [Coffea arabica]XP_027158937.1 transcription termination factor MTERF8, chloroplastic [Coffea eugenioides]
MADFLATLPTPSISRYNCRAPNNSTSGPSLPIKLIISTAQSCARASYAPTSSNCTIPFLGLRTTLLPRFCSTTTTIAVVNHNSTESFPNGRIMLSSLFQQLGFRERDVEALLNCNPALTLTPFDSIQSRARSLQALGLSHLALSRLILKRPEVLTAPEIDSLLHFFLRNDDLDIRGKIEPAKIERLLNATEPTFFLGFEDKIRLLLHHGIPQEKLVHVLNKANVTKALCLKSVDEIGRTLAFLNRFGGVDLILKRPSILNYDLDSQLIPRITFLLELSGRNEDATATVLRKLPFLVAYSLDHLSDHVEFLKSFAGLTESEIFRIVAVYPNLFSASRKRKLHPRIDFLKKCGLSSQDICRFLIKAPLFIGLSFEENLACKLVFLVKIGYENRTRELAMAMGAVTRTSCKNLQEVIGVFLNYGLTCEDILEMSKKHPQILQYNHESLEEKLDYLIEDMGREVGELLAFPAFLGYKLDGRIKHRYEMKKSSLGEGMSLNKLLSVSAARFSTKNKIQTISLIDDMK